MFNWIEVSLEPYEKRYQCLAEQLRKKGLENNFSAQTMPIDDSSWGKLQAQLSQLQGLRLGRGWGEGILRMLPDHSVHISRLGAADCLIKADGRWWPRSASYQGLFEVLTMWGKYFDLDSSALIVGAGAMARTSIAVLFREGFKRFSITALDKERGLNLIAQMQRVFLGAEFSFIPREELILLPGNYGIVVNTTPSSKDNALLQELSYFNFLAPGGIALDLYFNPAVTQFLKDAEEVGARIIPGYLVAATTDKIWAKWAADVEIPEQEYAEFLKSQFQS
jgi:shikimate 5-dehydrogenase